MYPAVIRALDEAVHAVPRQQHHTHAPHLAVSIIVQLSRRGARQIFILIINTNIYTLLPYLTTGCIYADETLPVTAVWIAGNLVAEVSLQEPRHRGVGLSDGELRDGEDAPDFVRVFVSEVILCVVLHHDPLFIPLPLALDTNQTHNEETFKY